MKNLHTTRRIWTIISTVIIIGLFFAYYLLVYVPNREEDLISKKYRALKQVGMNFSSLKDDYLNTIKQIFVEYQEKIIDCAGPDGVG